MKLETQKSKAVSLSKIQYPRLLWIHAHSQLRQLFFQALVRCLKQPIPVPLPVHKDDKSSGAGELPPDALTDPNVNLSAHSALIVQPKV